MSDLTSFTNFVQNFAIHAAYVLLGWALFHLGRELLAPVILTCLLHSLWLAYTRTGKEAKGNGRQNAVQSLSSGTDWINEVAEVVWPNMAPYLSQILRTKLEQILKAKNQEFNHLGYLGLNSKPISITNIVVHSSEGNDSILDIGFKWSCPVAANFAINGIGIALECCHCEGTIRLAFPKNNHLHTNKIEISMMESLVLKLKLTKSGTQRDVERGILSPALDMERISEAVSDSAVAMIRSYLVLPCKLSIFWNSDTRTFELKHHEIKQYKTVMKELNFELLQQMIRVNGPDFLAAKDTWYNRTTLHTAPSQEIGQLILESLSDACKRTVLLASDTYRKWTIIHYAVVASQHELLQYYYNAVLQVYPDDEGLQEWHRLLKRKDFIGKTALHYTKEGRTAEFLIKSVGDSHHGVKNDLLFARDDDGDTLLHHAAMFGRIDVVQYLVTLPAVSRRLIDVQNKHMETALHVAQSEDVVRYLKNAYKDKMDLVCIEDKNGNTALTTAIMMQHHEAASAILEQLDKETITYLLEKRDTVFNRNAFHLAAISPLIEEMFEVLLDYLDCVNIYKVLVLDIYGNTPLSYVSSRYSIKPFSELLMKVPLAARLFLLSLKNKKSQTCHTILQRRQFDPAFFLNDVLCDKRKLESLQFHRDIFTAMSHRRSLFKADSEFPAKHFHFQEQIFLVLKYATNQYSLLDQFHQIPHRLAIDQSGTESSCETCGMSQSDAALGCEVCGIGQAESSHSFDTCGFVADLTEDSLQDVHNDIRDLDITARQGHPKVAVLRIIKGVNPYISPPGPDFLIIGAMISEDSWEPRKLVEIKSTHLADTILSIPSINGLNSVAINSTLGRQFPPLTQVASEITQTSTQVNNRCRIQGKALIIYNTNDRCGWETERNDALKVLSETLKLEVTEVRDQSAREIIQTIKVFTGSIDSEPGTGVIVLALMAHGDPDSHDICGNEGRGTTVAVNEVIEAFCAVLKV